MPLITALGCSSQAAAAISTLSSWLRSLPAAKACRNAASENATARPVCWAKTAARIAASVFVGHSSGHLTASSP